MAAVIAYGSESSAFLSAVCVMHEYVFAVFRDPPSFTFPMFTFDIELIEQLPELLYAYIMGLYEDITAFSLYQASQVSCVENSATLPNRHSTGTHVHAHEKNICALI